MKILLCHNFYQQPGGEDFVFRQQANALEECGHTVIRIIKHNDTIDQMGRFQLAYRTIWNDQVYNEIKRICQRDKPDILHFHNTFPLISPSAFYAAQSAGCPVVQTIHNYRLTCLNAYFFRDNRVCEDCLGKSFPWPGIIHACYRRSRGASSVVAIMLFVHRLLGTYRNKVNRYLTLTEFSRDKLISTGIPVGKTQVIPNFVEYDPGVGNGSDGIYLFAGRLSPEKGLRVLLNAWQNLPGIRLQIAGTGEEEEIARTFAEGHANVEYLGRLDHADLLARMQKAKAIVVPSLWYEGAPNVITEGFACGTPALVSRLGGMAEMVRDGETGWTFNPGDADDLVRVIRQIEDQPEKTTNMRTFARTEYETKYAKDVVIAQLETLFKQVIENR